MMLAAEIGNSECLRALLEWDSEVEAKSVNGSTALILAAEARNVECVRILAEWGADMEAAEESGCTALMVAAEAGHIDCVSRLLAAGADMERKNDDEDKAEDFCEEDKEAGAECKRRLVAMREARVRLCGGGGGGGELHCERRESKLRCPGLPRAQGSMRVGSGAFGSTASVGLQRGGGMR